MSVKPLVIYHSGCPDGFGAAWSFFQKYGGDAEYYPAKHGGGRPCVKGREVFIVDFSYPLPTIEEMHEESSSLVIIDHHKTAQEALGHLDYAYFDMNHSGAYLAWAFLFGENDVPLLIRHIEDRDLWAWKMPNSKEVLSYLDSFDKDFSVWNFINEKLQDDSGYREAVSEGSAILRYKEQLIQILLSKTFRVEIDGVNIPVVNAPILQSDVAARLSIGERYSMAYSYNGDVYTFSLRSSEDGDDVSLWANKIGGGGGHKRASGFFIDNEDLIIKFLGSKDE